MANIEWLGHDSFRITSEDDKVIYIDPWKLKEGAPQADLILVTHEHFDHFSPDDIKKIRGKETVVVTTPTCARQLSGPVRAVGPGEKLTVAGFEIETVPAYNVNKFRAPGQPFHPKAAGHLGFIITVDGERIYHTGDTDVIPEMESIQCDIALLPVSGTYVMTADEAIVAAKLINPRLVIPMHFGEIVGSAADAEHFKEGCPAEVRILTPTA